MALTPGTRLGPYEIVSALGAGGMGEVYRATDTKLKRQVAVKVLPASLAADPARLARFRREAELLALLNHPNIAAIYGLDESPDGQAGQVGLFLVMELVEGEDLAHAIARGPVAVAEAIPIARQIAEALEAAHEQGIIHRDLKPANIKLRADGTVKVLDFGLAKALDSAGQAGGAGQAGADLTNSPTLTSPMTAAGIILGTAAYMAPEQARGKAVDRRADIWAFGCVLYEMLTGTRLFGGDSVAETLGLIFSREPDLAALPSTTPERVRTLIARCLAKDPRQRLRDIGEARVVLEGAFEVPARRVVAAVPATTGGRTAWRAVALLALAGIAAMALPAMRYLRQPPASLPAETRLDIVTPVTGRPTDVALSPDGRQMVYVASVDGGSRLWLRPLNATTAQPLPGTDGAMYPFWSPDSRSIGFFASNALKRLDLGGGEPQVLAPVTVGGGGTWNAEGAIVFAPGQGSTKTPLMRVSSAGGTATTAVTTLEPRHLGHRSPFFLPDGRRFLYSVVGPPDIAGIYLATLDGTGATRVTPADSTGTFLPSGWLVWVRIGTRTLVAQRLDLAREVLTGVPVTIADDIAVQSPTGNDSIAALSVASTAGLVAYRAGVPDRRQLTWFDRAGTSLGNLGPVEDTLRHVRLSPDGKRVVVGRLVDANLDLWLYDGARTTRFTFDPANDSFPVWSPDGARIAFNSQRTGTSDLFLRQTNGAGSDEPLVNSGQTKVVFSWSPDGRFLFYSSYDPKTNADLWVVPMAGDRTPSVILRTPFRETQPMISPDGQWLAYLSDQSGRNEIYVRPFVAPGATAASPDAQWQVSSAGGIYPTWKRDGSELYYLNPSGAMMAVPIRVDENIVVPGTPSFLFTTTIFGGGVDAQQGRQYDVAADGRFLINSVLPAAPAPITVIQNWNPEASK